MQHATTISDEAQYIRTTDSAHHPYNLYYSIWNCSDCPAKTNTLGHNMGVVQELSKHELLQDINDSFPFKLHCLLDDAEQKGLGHIVSWSPHGKSFMVCNRKEFMNILPAFFRMSKFESFQRQLNLYGFQRITRKGGVMGVYYHESFVRGRRDLCFQVQRQKVKGMLTRNADTPGFAPALRNNLDGLRPTCAKPMCLVPDISWLPDPIERLQPDTKCPFVDSIAVTIPDHAAKQQRFASLQPPRRDWAEIDDMEAAFETLLATLRVMDSRTTHNHNR